MKQFIEGIVIEVRREPDPAKEGWKYYCFEEVLLEHGTFLEPLPIDSDSEKGFAEPKYCYWNALQVAQQVNLTYTEGYAIAFPETPIPVQHA